MAQPNWLHPLWFSPKSRLLSPCRAPLAWCRLCFAAIIARCSYVPSMMPVPTMLMDVGDHLPHVSWHSPHCFRSRFSSYPVLLDALNPFFCPCLDSFLLPLTDDVGSVRSACDILSGPSSWSRQFSHHALTNHFLQQSLWLPLPSTFDQTSPLGNLSYFQPYLVLWQSTHFDLYFHRYNKKNKISLRNLSPYLHPFSAHNSPLTFPHISLTPYPPRHRLPCIVLRLMSDCPRAGLLLPPLCAAPGIALQPLPGWAALWLLPALSTLSSLRQAKINWAESEVGAVSRFTTFHHFCPWEANAWGFSSHLTYPIVFRMKYSIKGQQCKHYFISSTLSWLAHWLWHRCFLLVSPKPSFSYVVASSPA